MSVCVHIPMYVDSLAHTRIQKPKQVHWFEKFHWFLTSDNYLVLRSSFIYVYYVLYVYIYCIVCMNIYIIYCMYEYIHGGGACAGVLECGKGPDGSILTSENYLVLRSAHVV